MNLKEYLMNISTALENGDSVYHIMIDEHDFKLHKDCWIEFYDDFMIMYDKQTDVNLLVRYDSISAIQQIPEDRLNEIKSKAADLLKELMEAKND